MVLVIGAGLAGTEAAWQIARAGVPVRLMEMRPQLRSPAHHSAEFAELVCSNSFWPSPRTAPQACFRRNCAGSAPP